MVIAREQLMPGDPELESLLRTITRRNDATLLLAYVLLGREERLWQAMSERN